MDREIRPKHGSITKIAKILKCNRNSVKPALMGYVNTKLAKKIRRKAIELGGIEIEPKMK